MEVCELKVGILVNLNHQRSYDFQSSGRIEACGIDWAVCRSEDGRVWLLEPPEDFEICDEEAD